MKTILLLIGAIGTIFFGNANWIMVLANLVWLQFKDVTLIDWYWVLFTGIGFVISFITFVVAYISHLKH